MRNKLETDALKTRITQLLSHGSLNGSSLAVVMRSEKFTQSQLNNALNELESEKIIKRVNVSYNYKLLDNIISTHRCSNCIRGNCTRCYSLSCDCECNTVKEKP